MFPLRQLGKFHFSFTRFTFKNKIIIIKKIVCYNYVHYVYEQLFLIYTVVC